MSDGRSGAYNAEYRKAAIEARGQAGDQCETCGMDDDTSRDEYNSPLETHHITPVKDFADPDDAHTVDNLKLLCRRCHRHEEFGVVETDHAPNSDLDQDVIEFVESCESPVPIAEVADGIGIEETAIRGVVARMVSGGWLKMTVEGRLEV